TARVLRAAFGPGRRGPISARAGNAGPRRIARRGGHAIAQVLEGDVAARRNRPGHSARSQGGVPGRAHVGPRPDGAARSARPDGAAQAGGQNRLLLDPHLVGRRSLVRPGGRDSSRRVARCGRGRTVDFERSGQSRTGVAGHRAVRFEGAVRRRARDRRHGPRRYRGREPGRGHRCPAPRATTADLGHTGAQYPGTIFRGELEALGKIRRERGMNIRIVHIASNTFREAVRDRVLYNLIVFAVLMSGASILVGQISIDIERLVVINLGLTAVSLFGMVIAIFIGIGLVSKEIEKRTLYTVLSRPVRRWEFIVGKFFGLAGTLAVNTFFMAIGVFVALLYVSRHFQKQDGWVLVALYFIILQFLIITALTLFFSSFSSPLLS